MHFLDFSKNPNALPKTLGKTFVTRCDCGAIVQTNGLLAVQFDCPKCSTPLWVCDFCGWLEHETSSCRMPGMCTLSQIHATLKLRTDVVAPVLELPTLEES